MFQAIHVSISAKGFNSVYLIGNGLESPLNSERSVKDDRLCIMAKKESQVDHYEHSAIKVRLLRQYLEAYLSVIGHSPYFHGIHVYDLFCGEGIYPNGGKGSPVIILEAIKKIKESSTNSYLQSTKFYCTINDIDQKSYSKVSQYLVENSDSFSWLTSMSVENRNYRDFIPELSDKFPRLKKEKAFVFIDPYGYSDILVSDIKGLLTGNNSEVLLFLPTQFMYRFDNDAAPASLIRFVEELDPTGEWTGGESGLDFIEKVKTAFRKIMSGSFFVDTFVIAKAKNEFFCLFFFTAHIYGFQKMLEAKWAIDEQDGRGWSPTSYIKDSGQLGMFAETKIEPITYNLEKKLRDFLQDWKTNKDVYHFVLEIGYLPRHVNPLLKTMFKDNIIEAESLVESIQSISTFYIDYTNYKASNPPKIRMRIKRR